MSVRALKRTRSSLISSLALASVFTLLGSTMPGNAIAQPACSSPGSDPDGDGWGWENNATCLVLNGADEAPTPAQEQIAASPARQSGFCEFLSSDADGDGWGWENNASCRIDQSSREGSPSENTENTENDTPTTTTAPATNNGGLPVCQSRAADPDGDGYGWENNASCIVDSTSEGATAGPVVEIINVRTSTPTCSSSSADPDGDGWGWENNATCLVDTSGGSDARDAVDEEEATDAIDAIDEVGATDVPDANDATDTTDVPDASDATDTTDTPDANDATDTTDTPDANDVPDTTDAPDANDATDTTDASDANDATDTTDVPDANDAIDTTDVPDANDVADATDTTDANDATDATDATDDATTTEETTSSQQYQPEDITDLILVTGQSNTLGSNSSWNETDDSSHPRVFAYTSEGWQVAELYQSWDNGSHPGTGSPADVDQIHNNFALHFGKQLAALDDSIVVGFVLVSEPGEGIQHWAPGSRGMVRVQQKTLQAINELPSKSTIDGILWHQGETDWILEGTSDPDVPQPAPVNYYPMALATLIANLRLENWYDDSRPFICGETIQAEGVNTHLNALNTDTDPVTACVEGAGLPALTPGGSHFNGSSLRTLGHRYAEAYHLLR